MITKIQKWGNSHGVRIPQHILEAISAKDNQEVEVVVKDDSVVITPVKHKKHTIEELFDGYNGDYVPSETDTGAPQGKEVW